MITNAAASLSRASGLALGFSVAELDGAVLSASPVSPAQRPPRLTDAMLVAGMLSSCDLSTRAASARNCTLASLTGFARRIVDGVHHGVYGTKRCELIPLFPRFYLC